MKVPEKWLAVEILVDSQATEAIEFALIEGGALGTEIDLLGKRGVQESISVVGYFNEKPDDDFLQSQLSDALQIYGFEASTVRDLAWREVENRDWLAEWKKHWKPTITQKFIIAPVWETIENSDKIIIRIEPSMAFGTGTHETTRLCLQAIEAKYKGGSFLDVGTGTGILAIGAAKIAGKSKKAKEKIVGCDTDQDSIRIAIENGQINGVSEIEFYLGSIDESTGNFDFVCANLTADVIIPLLPLLIEKFKRTLVLSGILKEQEALVLGELKRLGVENCHVLTEGEWISVVVNN